MWRWDKAKGEAGDMMINKRLIGTVSESKKYIAGNVALQWCSIAANIAVIVRSFCSAGASRIF